jgi:hypothetical protein
MIINTIELRTRQRVTITAAIDAHGQASLCVHQEQEPGQERWLSDIKCRVDDTNNTLIIKDDVLTYCPLEPHKTVFHLLLAVLVAVALTGYVDSVNYPVIVTTAALFVAGVIFDTVRRVLSQCRPTGDWFFPGYALAIEEINLGRAGHLYLPHSISGGVENIEVRSAGGSLTFGPWNDHRFLVTAKPTQLSLRLSGSCVIDGRGSELDSLSLVTGSGAGTVKNMHVLRHLCVVARSSLSRATKEEKTIITPSHYQIDLQHNQLCTVDVCATTSRHGITLNGKSCKPFDISEPDNPFLAEIVSSVSIFK